jgi:ubiquinone/menaquinone biosynthesis C-methylase UbiE
MLRPESDLDRLRGEYARRTESSALSRRYSVFDPANLFLLHGRQRAVLRLLGRQGIADLSELQILEIGCGGGGVLLEWASWGASPEREHGIDVLFERLTTARARSPLFRLSCASGADLPYRRGAFHVVMQFTAFSSILDPQLRMRMAAEMRRVLKPGGLIVWYDFWINPVNRQTVGLGRAAVRELFPGCEIDFTRLTLAPPIARRVVPLSRALAGVLEGLRIFDTHLLAAIRPS